MEKEHTYHVRTEWTGNDGNGTADVKRYNRSHTVFNAGKPDLFLTTDNAAVGEKHKLNPEDLLVSALSSCHMLSYLYLCSLEGIVVHHYTDNVTGRMIESTEGGGKFKEVLLHPQVVVASANMVERAIQLHHKAHAICYIANSVNFTVSTHPTITVLVAPH